MYAQSINLTSTTFVAAFANLIPPFTFIIATMFRLEKVEISKISGKAKVIGLLVGVGGAMLLTFYKGHQLINIGSTRFNLLHGGRRMDAHMTPPHNTSAHIFGSILALIYSLFIALCYILQSKLTVKYPCHYSNTFLFSVFGFIQSLVYVVITERSWNQVKLNSRTRLFSAIVQGLCSILAVSLALTVVRLQGPLFVSVFNPLVLIFVAMASILVLGEKLYVGSLLGSIIIIAGLYMVLWGKSKETKRSSTLASSVSSKDVNAISNTTITLETVSMAPNSFTVSVDKEDELPPKSSREKHEEHEIVEED
ncbi:hypothetical protein E3N88_27968 [Mikania micrantha]|uniref:WAT1-related protein n=1 Tax=Mikania micrantha TaxID=192012 RepID=A0A5N6MZB7_9ASTR|nr:hypothetical protein E3N88_27968 [Mikania micrantha]